MVSGIISASSGIGNTVLSPTVQAMISDGGLRYCMTALSVITTAIIPVSFFIVRYGAVGQRSSRGKGEPTEKLNINQLLHDALHNRAYLFLMAGFFTCGFHMSLISNHLPTQLGIYGFSAETASYIFSFYGIATLAGSFASGAMCSKFKLKNVLAALYGARPVTVALSFVMPKALPAVILYTIMLGFTGTATVPPVSGIIRNRFGAASVAILYGIVLFSHQIGGFLSSWLGGVCYDVTGGYSYIWIADIALSAFAAAISFAITEEKETQGI